MYNYEEGDICKCPFGWAVLRISFNRIT